tara:strand:- start:361 stop:564 length:204 start_codon:yes stop_codon:yes gene_type:complete
MMIELANRINYLEDKLKDLAEQKKVLEIHISILKVRVQELEDKVGIDDIDTKLSKTKEEIFNYGGSK